MSKKLVAGLPLILWVALFGSPRFVGATDLRPPRIIVGMGTPESCTETALQDAVTTARLSGGGMIKFRCGADPVTIVLSVQSSLESGYMVTLNLPDNTTIDGEDTITLTGRLGNGSIIYVDPAATVILKNLSLKLGSVSFTSLIWNTGSLTLQNVNVSGHSSGREIINDGKLRIRNSTVSGNNANGASGLGLSLLENTGTGTLVVSDTVFSDNNGTGITNEGTAAIDNSSFLRLFADGAGPAIFNYSGTVVVRGTRFSNNGTRTGGAVANAGTLVLKDSTFSDNSASWFGGALSNSGTATIENSQFSGNQVLGQYGGGAIFNSGTLNVRNSGFTDNLVGPTFDPSNPSSAAYGGALYNASTSTLIIKFSTFSGNSADYGGAIANGGLVTPFFNWSPNGGTVRIGNSVITNNTAGSLGGGLGGGIYNDSTGTLRLDRDTQVTDNTPDDIFP